MTSNLDQLGWAGPRWALAIAVRNAVRSNPSLLDAKPISLAKNVLLRRRIDMDDASRQALAQSDPVASTLARAAWLLMYSRDETSCLGLSQPVDLDAEIVKLCKTSILESWQNAEATAKLDAYVARDIERLRVQFNSKNVDKNALRPFVLFGPLTEEFAEEPFEDIRVVICYARKDVNLLRSLLTHLSATLSEYPVTIWYDGKIEAGASWSDEIAAELDKADVILLLISPDFFNSGFIERVEIVTALNKHQLGHSVVIPVLLRPSHGWEDSPIGFLQGLPRDGAVSLSRNRDLAFEKIASGVREQIKKLLTPDPSVQAGLWGL